MPKKSMMETDYIQALIQTIRGPFLILDSKLRVVEANQDFYRAFKVNKEETEKKLVYELGNGQWNIPALKKLLEEVLPAQKMVKDYEVEHDFETIGHKIMMLNANQVDSVALIIVAFEDVTVERRMEKKVMEYTRSLEAKASLAEQLGKRVKELEALSQA